MVNSQVCRIKLTIFTINSMTLSKKRWFRYYQMTPPWITNDILRNYKIYNTTLSGTILQPKKEKYHFTLEFISEHFWFACYQKRFLLHTYSVSTLETTIFREIISLVRVNFRSTFLSSWLTPYFYTLLRGQYTSSIAPNKSGKIHNQVGAVCILT